MNIKYIITLSITIISFINSKAQIQLPFELETTKHSSYCGTIAQVDEEFFGSTPNLNDYPSLNSPISLTEKEFIKKELQLIETKGNIHCLEESNNESLVNITIVYTDYGFECSSDLKLTLGFDQWAMNSNELQLQLPRGRYYYGIQGELKCLKTDDSNIKSEGIIDLEEDMTLYLSWELIDYQESWMTLHAAR